MKTILKVLVGSRANGLYKESSDYDYREVRVESTSNLLKIGNRSNSIVKIQENQDNVFYEIEHFLKLSSKSNPSVLEVFVAPTITLTKEGEQLKDLFSVVWDAENVRDAFLGYSHSQKKKILNETSRSSKFALAYIRTVLNAIQLLYEGTFSLSIPVWLTKYEKDTGLCFIPKDFASSWLMFLIKIRNEEIPLNQVIDITEKMTEDVKMLAVTGPFANKHTNIEKLNDFLLEIRKNNW